MNNNRWGQRCCEPLLFYSSHSKRWSLHLLEDGKVSKCGPPCSQDVAIVEPREIAEKVAFTGSSCCSKLFFLGTKLEMSGCRRTSFEHS